MTRYEIRMDSEIAPIPIDSADTIDEAQRIADDWNKRYETQDPRFDTHAKVYPIQ